jgi:hypothetical protein
VAPALVILSANWKSANSLASQACKCAFLPISGTAKKNVIFTSYTHLKKKQKLVCTLFRLVAFKNQESILTVSSFGLFFYLNFFSSHYVPYRN